MGNQSSFISKFALEDFVEKHDSVNNYSFVKNLNDAIESNYKRIDNLSNQMDIKTKKLNEVNNQLNNCYGIEKNHYSNLKNELTTEIGELEGKILIEKNITPSKKRKLESEKKILQEYPVVLSTGFLKQTFSGCSYANFEFGKGFVSTEKIAFDTDFPLYVVYNLSKDTATISFDCSIGTHLSDSLENIWHRESVLKSVSPKIPFSIGSNKPKVREKVPVGERYKNPIRKNNSNFISKFRNNISNSIEKINKAKGVFGNDIYVISKAEWFSDKGQLMGNSFDDSHFLVVGYNKDIRRTFLIDEK